MAGPRTGARNDGGREPRRWLRDIGTIVVVLLLMSAVTFLPQDTSLSELRKGGILRACVPQEFPPLVQRDADMPGVDVEIMQAVAADLGVRLVLNPNGAIGREVDPRAWNITRGNCQIVGGGIVANNMMRSFMLVTQPHLGTGWAVIGREPLPDSLDGVDVGVHVGMVARDRIALSRLLRERGAVVSLVDTADQLARDLATGRLDAGVTDALLAGAIATARGFDIVWLSDDSHDEIGLALWKGDVTLSRAVERSIAAMRRDGRLEAILDRYAVALPERVLGE